MIRRTGQSGPVFEVGKGFRERRQFIVIEQALLVADAEDESKVVLRVSAELRKQHGTERRDACTGGHKNGIGKRAPQYECSIGPLEVDLGARAQ